MKTFYTKTKTWALGLAVCCLAAVGSANAQSGGVPANDDCSAAEAIACGETLSGTTTGSTADNVGTCVTSNTAPGVWYVFSGDGSDVTASLCGSGYDTKISVFTGSCGALECVTGNDDACSLQSEATFSTLNGQDYYILVHGFSSNTGSYSLAVTCAAPGNDLCGDAYSLSCGDMVIGSTSASTGTDAPDCGNSGSPGVWFTFTGDGNDVYLDLSGSDFDTYMGITEGCSGTCVASDDDGGDGTTSAIGPFATVNGTVYNVYIRGFAGATGNYELSFQCAVPPANDACADAEALECGDVATGSTLFATADAETDGVTCSTTSSSAPDVWYSVEGTGLDITASLCNSDYDTKLFIYEGACGSLTCVADNDDACSLQSEATWTSTLGTTYLIRVAGFLSNAGDYELAITCAAPANDLCTGAEAIACGDVVTGNTITATTDPQITQDCNGNSTGNGVWYVLAGNGKDVTVSTCSANTGFDTEISVFSGACGSLACEAFNDDDSNCGSSSLQSTATFYAEPGVDYYVRVSYWSSSNSSSGEFELSVACACPSLDAGTSTADATPVCMSSGSATVAVTPDANQVAPAGYTVTGVLADAAGNVLDAGALSYSVTAAGDYYVHVAVVDPADLALYLTATTVAGLHALTADGGGSLCGSIDQTGTLVTVNEEPTAVVSGGGDLCSGEAATVTIDFTGTAPWTVQWAWDGVPGTTEGGITSNPYTFAVPTGTFGELTIVALSDDNGCTGTSSGSAVLTDITPSASISGDFISCNAATVEAQIDFTGVGPWDVTLMTPGGQSVPLTGITDNPYMLPLNNPQAGSYTLTAVSDANCASGTVSGAATVALENPDAGALTADESPACYEAPFITISATADGNAVEPSGYQTVYLLVDANGDVVNSGASASFAVTALGDYVIHTLVYDPNTLTPGDYSTVADLLAVLTQGGGSICAALDETGAAISVVDCTPPANDLCADAETIECGDVVSGDFTFATADLPTNDCGNSIGQGVWYVFAGTGDLVTVETCGSTTDTEITVLEGDCNSQTCVGFSDDGCGLQSTVTFASEVGTNYYVYVSWWSSSSTPSSGDFDLTVTCVAPPTNDEACGAEALSMGANGPYAHSSFYTASTWEAAYTVPTVGCTEQGGWCIDVDIENSAWYSFVAPASGNVTISASGSSFDTQLAVFSGTCQDVEGGTGVLVGANDDSPADLTSLVILCGLNPGDTYYVLADGWGAATGDLTLTLTEGMSASFTSSATNLDVDFTDASTSAGSVVDWAWDFDDMGATSTDQDPSYSFSAGGTYNVCLTATDDLGCTSTYCEDVIVTDIPTSIAEAVDNGMEVYPNPSNGTFVVEISGVEAIAQLVLVDVAGRQVYTEGVTLNGNFRKDLSLNVADGMYLLQVVTEEGVATRKVRIH